MSSVQTKGLRPLALPDNAEKSGDITCILAADVMIEMTIKVDHTYKLLQALDGVRSPESSDSFDLIR